MCLPKLSLAIPTAHFKCHCMPICALLDATLSRALHVLSVATVVKSKRLLSPDLFTVDPYFAASRFRPRCHIPILVLSSVPNFYLCTSDISSLLMLFYFKSNVSFTLLPRCCLSRASLCPLGATPLLPRIFSSYPLVPSRHCHSSD